MPAMVVLVSILFMLFKLNCDAYMVPKSLHTVCVLDSLCRVMSDINDDDDDFLRGLHTLRTTIFFHIIQNISCILTLVFNCNGVLN